MLRIGNSNKFAIPSLGLSTHFVRRLPRKFALPKALQTIRDANRLTFLTLIRSIKRACFAASH
jgi:hypothetical protein